MENQSIMDIDAPVIVKLDKFYQGNIFIDDGMIAVCRFSSYLVELDISTRTKVDLSLLFDLFEDEFSEVYDQIVEFYEDSDFLSLAEDCITAVSSKSVQRYCRTTYKQLEKEDVIDARIELLNKLLVDSTLTPDKLPLPSENCIYHTERNLFEIRSKRSSKKNIIYRFNIAKKVYQYLMSDEEFSVRIELLNSKTKIRFHVSDGYFDKKLMFTESRAVISNNDGSLRVNFSPNTFERLSNIENPLDLFIYFMNNEILFSFCE